MDRNDKGYSRPFEDVMAARDSIKFKAFLRQESSYVIKGRSLWVVSEALKQFASLHIGEPT